MSHRQKLSADVTTHACDSLGKDGISKTDEFSEKFQTAFDLPPRMFANSIPAR